jgi:transposase
MAQRFIACGREQSFRMAPDVREWLPEDHFAWFGLDAVESTELDAFYGAYRADGGSRPAFDPAMMVALMLYAYARGVRSSRAIERGRVEDIAYRVIAAQDEPDHATIARFAERARGKVRVTSCAMPWQGQLRQGRRRTKILIAGWQILARNEPFRPLAPRATDPVPASSSIRLAA